MVLSDGALAQAAVKNVEDCRTRANLCLLPKAKTHSVVIITCKLMLILNLLRKQSLTTNHQFFLWWIVELGRFNLAMEVLAMAAMMALSREGHVKVGFHILSFLKIKHNGVTVFDPSEPEIDLTQFLTEYWPVMPYGACKEDVPFNALAPRGIGFTMRALVEFD